MTTTSNEDALKIIKFMMLAIESSDIRRFEEALIAYTAYLEHLRKNENGNPDFMKLQDEMSLDPINTRATSILPDDCEDEVYGTLAEEYSAPIFMAVEKLIKMSEDENRRAFQAHLKFIQSLIQDFHADVNLYMIGYMERYSLLNHFITSSKSLSPNKCRVILFFLIDMGIHIHDKDSLQSSTLCPLHASLFEGNEICFHLLREKDVFFWDDTYNVSWGELIKKRRFSIVIALIEQHEELNVDLFDPPLQRGDNVLHMLAYLFDIRKNENDPYNSFRNPKSIQEDIPITKFILQNVSPAILKPLLYLRNGENKTPEELLIYDILPHIQKRVKAIEADIVDIRSEINGKLFTPQWKYKELERSEQIKTSLCKAYDGAFQCLQLLESIDHDPNLEKRLAFAMGQSKGAGAESLTHGLSPETVQQILRSLHP